MVEKVVCLTRTYDDIMDALREKRLNADPDLAREALISDLPVDGDKIRLSMLDSKSDLQDLIDGCERFRL